MFTSASSFPCRGPRRRQGVPDVPSVPPGAGAPPLICLLVAAGAAAVLRSPRRARRRRAARGPLRSSSRFRRPRSSRRRAPASDRSWSATRRSSISPIRRRAAGSTAPPTRCIGRRAGRSSSASCSSAAASPSAPRSSPIRAAAARRAHLPRRRDRAAALPRRRRRHRGDHPGQLVAQALDRIQAQRRRQQAPLRDPGDQPARARQGADGAAPGGRRSFVAAPALQRSADPGHAPARRRSRTPTTATARRSCSGSSAPSTRSTRAGPSASATSTAPPPSPLRARGGAATASAAATSGSKRWFGRSRGLTGTAVGRLRVGVAFDDSAFAADPRLPAGAAAGGPPSGLPLDLLAVARGPLRRRRDVDRIDRPEDLNLGWSTSARAGWSARSFGADRDALLFEASAARGWRASPRQLLFPSLTLRAGSIAAAPRRSSLRWACVTTCATSGVRPSSPRPPSTSRHLEPDQQLLLGGDTGLRGYPLRYQEGDRRFLLNLEQRWYGQREFFKVVRFGAAASPTSARPGSEEGPRPCRPRLAPRRRRRAAGRAEPDIPRQRDPARPRLPAAARPPGSPPCSTWSPPAPASDRRPVRARTGRACPDGRPGRGYLGCRAHPRAITGRNMKSSIALSGAGIRAAIGCAARRPPSSRPAGSPGAADRHRPGCRPFGRASSRQTAMRSAIRRSTSRSCPEHLAHARQLLAQPAEQAAHVAFLPVVCCVSLEEVAHPVERRTRRVSRGRRRGRHAPRACTGR